MSSTSARPLALLVALAFLAAACRGTTGSAGPGAATTTATATATPLPANLTSFRYTLTAQATTLVGAPAPTTGAPTPISLTVTGEVAATDRQRSTSHLNLGFGVIDSDRIRIGDRTWTRDGTGPWIEERTLPAGTTPGTATRAVGLNLDPAVFVGSEAHERLRRTITGVPSTPDHIGALDVAKFTLNAAQVRTLLDAGPGSAGAGTPTASVAGITDTWTLWVTRDRWLPVRLLADTAEVPLTPSASPTPRGAVHLDLTLTDHNAPLTIQPPQ